ncbi:hypothetical protein AA313_de0207827 [Arthrobotrys entomopaga]|nr:hypothetical protein AA313_de0207827 [Arthrobotrys entomopaga]
MVRLSHTPLSRNISHAYKSQDENPSVDSIDHVDIAKIARELGLRRPTSKLSYGLDILLRGTEIHIPKLPPKPKPSAEYLALMERLKHEQEEKAYAKMIGSNQKDETIQSISKEVSNQISVILNVFFSSFFMGLAIWYATANLSTYKNKEPLRVGASITVAIIVAIAEVTLYGSYLRKMEDAKSRERSTPEVKTFIEPHID